jgi:DNA-binding LytR/AlgR family response regulator
MKINCILIEDEPIARQGMAEYIAEIDFLHLTGQAANVLAGNNLLNQSQIDLIFLDIHLPKINGIDFLKNLKNPPMVIFTTAYPEYALKGFELDALDYLVKPIVFDRFLKVVNKARDFFALTQKANENSIDYFFVKCAHKFEKILLNELLFIESLQNYVVLHTHNRKLITYLTLKSIEDNLLPAQFIKTHKSYIIAIDKIENIEGMKSSSDNTDCLSAEAYAKMFCKKSCKTSFGKGRLIFLNAWHIFEQKDLFLNI